MENIKEKSLLTLAIPILFELLLIMVVGNIDTIMLGYYSDKAVGAVGGINQILTIQNMIFGFINLATSIICAQFLGANIKEKINELITVAISLNIGLSVLIGGIFLIFWEYILIKMKLPLELIELGESYIKLVGGLCIFQAMTLTCSAIQKSHGNTQLALYVNIGVNILNIIGNGIFIFGWFGAPILGVLGVGISTVFSRGIGCLVAFILLKRSCNFKLKLEYLKKFPKDILKKILIIGVPAAGENFAWNMGQLLIMAMINTMGTETIVARTYLMLISGFALTFSISLGQATAIQIGHLVGARNSKEAYERGIKSLKLSMVLSLIVIITIVIFRTNIISLFTENKRVIEISLVVFPIMIFLEVGRVLNIVLVNSLHAAGDIKYPMVLGISSIFLVAVHFSYILGIKLGMGLVGIWVANALDEWCRGIGVLIRWESKKWKDKRLV